MRGSTLHNSASKLTSHFGPIKTANPEDGGAQFSVLFFLQDGNEDYSALESLHVQSFLHWELIIVRPPTSCLEHRHDQLINLGDRNVFSVDYGMIWEFLNSRPTRYIAFLQQEAIWHSERLAHDYYLLESNPVAAVLCVPLVWAVDKENAFVPRTSVTKNAVIAGRELLQQFAEQKAAYFDLDTVSVRRSTLLSLSLDPYTYATVALLRLLQSSDVYCSDKCLSARRKKPVFKLQDLAGAAKELLTS